ncbi:MAG: hypothetical protein R3D60_09490 [Paracoccaceae bacterium]
MSRKKLIALVLFVGVSGLSACNTVEGIGRDISGGSNMVRGWFSR